MDHDPQVVEGHLWLLDVDRSKPPVQTHLIRFYVLPDSAWEEEVSEQDFVLSSADLHEMELQLTALKHGYTRL